jgi:phosphate transport system substrate-binding protein
MASSKKGPPPIVYVLMAIVLGGVGWWWLSKRGPQFGTASVPSISNVLPGNSKLPDSVTEINVDGATSLVEVNKFVKDFLVKDYPNLTINLQAGGTDTGIKRLIEGGIDVAAISRPLTKGEREQGLDSKIIATDAIAIIVSINNPIKGSLTKTQLTGILHGSITNWSQLGGPDRTIRVINRPATSGTYKIIEGYIGGQFSSGDNVINMESDSTTKMIQMLGVDGIGYATLSQAKAQQTVKTLSIDGKHPSQDGYGISRPLAYAYRTPMNPTTSTWIDTALRTR